MAGGQLAQPLLAQDGQDVEAQISFPVLDVDQLFKEHPYDTVKYLQTKGIVRRGEFEAKASHVLPAFEKDPLLTLGSSTPNIKYEEEWRRVLAGGENVDGAAGGVAVEAYTVTIRGASYPDCEGLVQPLLKRYQSGRTEQDVFTLPAVQAIISWKWWTYCRKLLLVELAFFLVWFVAFNTFAILYQDEDLSLSLPELLATSRGKVEVASLVLALFGMAPFVVLEVGTLLAYGWGWLDATNTVDIVTYTIQVTVTVLHLGRMALDTHWMTVLPALQLILLVFRLLYFLQAFRITRISFIDTMVAVFRSTRFIFLTMYLMMWGFGGAFHIIFRRDQEATTDFDSMGHSFVTMFQSQGGLDVKAMYQTKSPYIATILALVWTFVSAMVLVNLLVAFTFEAVGAITGNAETKMLLSRARIIDELEATIPSWLERRNPQWFPAFVHFLRINPDKIDKVDPATLWSVGTATA